MKRSRQKGFILVFVMGLLLLLGVLATLLASVSLAESRATVGAGLQSQAVGASLMGAQDAVARLRTGKIDWLNLPICQSAVGCGPPSPYYLVDGVGWVPDFSAGYPNARYLVTVFKRLRDSQASMGNQAPIVVISSEGHSLVNTGYLSVTEVEVQMPQGAKTSGPDGTGLDW